MNLCINGKYDNPQIVLPKQIPPFLVNGLHWVWVSLLCIVWESRYLCFHPIKRLMIRHISHFPFLIPSLRGSLELFVFPFACTTKPVGPYSFAVEVLGLNYQTARECYPATRTPDSLRWFSDDCASSARCPVLHTLPLLCLFSWEQIISAQQIFGGWQLCLESYGRYCRAQGKWNKNLLKWIDSNPFL